MIQKLVIYEMVFPQSVTWDDAEKPKPNTKRQS